MLVILIPLNSVLILSYQLCLVGNIGLFRIGFPTGILLIIYSQVNIEVLR